MLNKIEEQDLQSAHNKKLALVKQEIDYIVKKFDEVYDVDAIKSLNVSLQSLLEFHSGVVVDALVCAPEEQKFVEVYNM